MIDIVVLSAGLSSRFGSPKALAKVNSNTTVIGHVQQMLLRTSVNKITVVLGANADQIKPLINSDKRVECVMNYDYELGQTSSFKAGLNNVDSGVSAVAMLPVDCPCVSSETIDGLIAAFKKDEPLLLIPTHEDRKGHPPLFHQSLIPEILALDNHTGLNMISRNHEKELILSPVNDPGVLQTFNTPEEFEQLKNTSFI